MGCEHPKMREIDGKSMEFEGVSVISRRFWAVLSLFLGPVLPLHAAERQAADASLCSSVERGVSSLCEVMEWAFGLVA